MAKIFSDSVGQLSKNAVELSKAFGAVRHQGMKGQLREAIVTNLFAPFLPPDVKCVTGHVVSADGRQSNQIDIIVYSPSIMPGFLLEKTGFVPIEACLYTIEIKSKLTFAELRKSVDSSRAVRKMPILKPKFHSPNLPVDQHWTGNAVLPVNAVFAFDTDLKGPAEGEITRYRKIDAKSESLPAIQALCIVGRGYWKAESNGSWRQVPAIDEAVAFLAGMTNTIPSLMAYKGRPSFGEYLLEEGQLGEPF